jgi:peptide/nickel transport system substrate-binding protein
MHLRKLWLLAGVVLAALAVVTTGSASQQSANAGGTVIFGADQEPGILNGDIIGGNLFWGTEVISPVFPTTFRVYPDFSFRPELATTTVKTNPFRLTYHIKKNAVWYEAGGPTRPITAADYVTGLSVIMNKNFKILSQTGYEDIKSHKCVPANCAKAKTVTFTFSVPFAGWKTLFGSQGVMPSFAVNGEDFNKVWINDLDNPKDGKPISGGPFYLPNGGWDRGKQLTLLRNPKFWGPKAKLAKAVYRFLPDTNTTAEAIRGREVDVIYPQPQLFLVPLRHTAGIKTQIGRGPIFEHLDFNVGFGKGPFNPLLKNLKVRQAIAYGIDRRAIVNALYTKTDIAPGLPVLNDPIILTGNKFYKGHWKAYTHNAKKAIALMKSAGCTGGPATPGAGGTWTCNGTKASFKFKWKSGNQLRELTFEAMQAQLKDVGIQLVADDTPNALSEDLPNGNYDIILFAWVGSPDISGWDDIYGCRSGSNHAQDNNQGYCNNTVDRDLVNANHQLNTARQYALTNAALAQMVKQMPIIPLYQKPTYLIYRTAMKGLIENPTSEGPVWNINKWTKA